MAFSVAVFIPVIGPAIAGGYVIANIISEAATGENIGEHIKNW